MRTIVAGLLFGVALVAGMGGTPASAAPWDPGVLGSDTVRVATTPLEAASLAFAGAFSDPVGDRLAGILASRGIRLHIEDAGHAGLSSRQAVAALREFLRSYEEGSVVVTRAASVEGLPSRGFAELLWSARVTGTSQAVRRTLFLGLLQEDGEWKVDEVRLLR